MKHGKKTIVALAILSTARVFAADYHLNDAKAWSFNFVAPSAFGTSAVADKQVGAIIFDTSTHQFEGLDDSGNWNSMTVAGGNVVISSGSSERVERLLVGTTCTSGSCTVATESGNWLDTSTTSGVEHTGATGSGAYTIHIASGIFSATPQCAFTVGGASTFAAIRDAGSSATNYNFKTTGAGGPADGNFEAICMGPKP